MKINLNTFMKNLITLFLIFISLNSSFSQWTQQTAPTGTFNLFSFSFPSVNTGFAVGYGNTMIKTTNSGNNWFNISIFPNTAQDLNSVWFINENTGWMCSTNDTLYHTTNSAQTWTPQIKLASNGQKIFFIDSNTGWILAQPRLYKTINSGVSWTVINSQMGQYFTFINSNTGWMTSYPGGGSIIHKTTDGGVTYSPQYTTTNFRVIYCLDFINENTGWAAGYREHILKTTDGGVNWVQQRDMNNSAGFYSIKFLNENTGWVIGDPGVSVYTLNGGKSWNQIFLPAGRGNIQFLNSNTGWVIGSKIFKTTTSGFVYRNLQLTALLEGFYNGVNNLMISDTTSVYLKNSVSPYENIDSCKSVINANGSGSFSFLNAVNGSNYYLVIKHRNSIETWSSTPQSFVNNSLNFDLSNNQSQAFGNNLKQVNYSLPRFGLFSGDIDQDGIIDGSDLNLAENSVASALSGYITADVTGDNFADGSDISIVENNTLNGVSVVSP